MVVLITGSRISISSETTTTTTIFQNMLFLCDEERKRSFSSPKQIACTPEVNFINILRAAFSRVDPKSKKKTEDFTVFFPL